MEGEPRALDGGDTPRVVGARPAGRGARQLRRKLRGGSRMDASDLGRRIVDRAQRGARGDAIPTPDLGPSERVGAPHARRAPRARCRARRRDAAHPRSRSTCGRPSLPARRQRRDRRARRLDQREAVDVRPHPRAAQGAVVHVSPVRRRPLLGRRLRGAAAGDTGTRATQVRPLLPPGLPATTRTAIRSRARRGSSGSRPARRSPPACCSPPSCSRSVRTPTAGSS